MTTLETNPRTRRALLRRGLGLEYITPGWNVAAVPILLITAAGADSVALAGLGVDSLIEIIASAVVVWQLHGEEGSGRATRCGCDASSPEGRRCD